MVAQQLQPRQLHRLLAAREILWGRQDRGFNIARLKELDVRCCKSWMAVFGLGSALSLSGVAIPMRWSPEVNVTLSIATDELFSFMLAVGSKAFRCMLMYRQLVGAGRIVCRERDVAC
jgi:hypothetical protein